MALQYQCSANGLPVVRSIIATCGKNSCESIYLQQFIVYESWAYKTIDVMISTKTGRSTTTVVKWGGSVSAPHRGGLPRKSFIRFVWDGVLRCILSAIFVRTRLQDVATETPCSLVRQTVRDSRSPNSGQANEVRESPWGNYTHICAFFSSLDANGSQKLIYQYMLVAECRKLGLSVPQLCRWYPA